MTLKVKTESWVVGWVLAWVLGCWVVGSGVGGGDGWLGIAL